MVSSDGQPKPQTSGLLALWARVPVVIRAIVVGFAYLRYFRGSWWPESTREARRLRFRDTRLSASVWKWSLLAGALAVVVLESGLMVTFRFFEFPADTWVLPYDFGAVPSWLAWLSIIMASSVAGITEEVGFRGYMQVPLEQRHGSTTAITIVAVMFVVVHLNQAWVAPPILVLLFVLGALWGILAHSAGSLIPVMISHVVADIFNFSAWSLRRASTPTSCCGPSFSSHRLGCSSGLRAGLELFVSSRGARNSALRCFDGRTHL